MHGGTVVILTLHAGAAAAALFFLPRGFALVNVHAWSDTWIPAFAVLAIVASLLRFVFFRSSAFVVSLGLAAIAGGWLAASITGLVLFPISFGVDRAVGPLAIAIALGAFAWLAKFRVLPTLAAAVFGAALGVVEIYGQKAPPPSTRPLSAAPGASSTGPDAVVVAEVHGEPEKEEAATGQVSFPCGKEHVRIRPLLTFESRSPDATWTVLAPPDAFGPHRKLDAFAKEKSGFRAHYIDDGVSSLLATKDSRGLDVEGVSKLTSPVYSHLNAFTTIHVPFDASISFSATGEERFTIESADGDASSRPLQMAYLGSDIVFHVVRANDAEKGPYTEIAKGHLGRDEPLTIEIRHVIPPSDKDKDSKDKTKDKGKDREKEKEKEKERERSAGTCKLTFKDWSSQVSTDASPTAGWGIPQNSIQFSAHTTTVGGKEIKEGLIVITLAETGPGRGWHSVGHSEGTYKNRIRVDTVMDPPRPPPPPAGK